MTEMEFESGCNPDQKPARIYMEDGSDLPFEVLNGQPTYANFINALNAWQLVSELRQMLHLPAVATFKHNSPISVAVGIPLSNELKQVCFVENIAKLDSSPLASACARARGANRISSYGDWVALSDVCDEMTAKLLRREVSDGIIAPGYKQGALEILKHKRKGNFNVVSVDSGYLPEETERQQVFGVTFEQGRSEGGISPEFLRKIVTENRNLPGSALRDLMIAMVTVKYARPDSACYALGGQTIGVGIGQLSAVECARLAGAKADTMLLRRSKKVLALPLLKNLNSYERDRVIDSYINGHEEDVCADGVWQKYFTAQPEPFTREEKRAYLNSMDNVAFATNASFSHSEIIERVRRSGVQYIVQPGGTSRDEEVVEYCDKHDLFMIMNSAVPQEDE